MWKDHCNHFLGIGWVSLLWWAPFPLPHWVSAVVTLAGGWTYPSSASIRAGEGGKAPGLGSVGFAVILGAFQLNLQPLHSDLETIHGLDGSLRRDRIVIADEPWDQKSGRHVLHTFEEQLNNLFFLNTPSSCVHKLPSTQLLSVTWSQSFFRLQLRMKVVQLQLHTFWMTTRDNM